MKEREVRITNHDSIDLGQLSEAEERAFYATLLARMLEQYRQQREEAE